MKQLSYGEVKNFAIFYLDGIMNQGLLQPLEDFAKSNSGPVADFAKSWFDLQLAGETPQGALRKTTPAISVHLAELLSLGFERSVLDLVLKDIIESDEPVIPSLIAKYSKINTEIICADCWQSEFSKMIGRAKVEDANLIVLEQEGEDFLHQKYIGPKLVHVKEASISAVYKTLKKTLSDASELGRDLRLEDDSYKVIAQGPSEFSLLGSYGKWTVRLS